MCNMWTKCVVLFLLPLQDTTAKKCCVTVEDTELVMAFLVHRHGDRSPVEGEMVFSDDPEQLAKMSEPYGIGELTEIGKVRSYILGQFLRRRYNKFLSPSYKPSDIFVRSIDMNRTQMTAKITITAAYSSKGLWSDDMELVPLEMNVTPVSIDPNEFLLNCQKFKVYYGMIIENNNLKDMRVYDEVLDISKGLDFNLSKTSLKIYIVHNLFASQQNIGMPLSDLYRRLLPTVTQRAGLAVDYIFGNQNYVPLQAGVLLKEFFDTADQIISGADIPRFRVLSAHDINVVSFVAVTRAVPRQGVPGYCSVYSLELRRCKSNGEYFVVPVYVKNPEDPEAYLEIEHCGVMCNYQKFRELTAKNVMTEEQYKTRCKTSDDVLPIDFESALLE